ncbi:MAG: hypothetical protein QW350_05325 [Candidatus Aenigmatarchaeota archaeon]
MPKLSPYQKELLNQLKAMNPYFIQDYYIKEISTYQDDKCITLETDYIDNCYYSITICYDLGYDLYNFKVKRFCENHKSNTYEYLEKEGFYFDQIYPFIDNLLNGYYDHKFEEKSIIEERNTKKRRLKEEDEHKIKAKDLAFLSIDFINEGISDPYLKKRVALSDRDKIYVNTQPFLEYALKQRLETFQKIVNQVNLKKVSSENIEKILLKLKAYIKEGFRNIPNSCFHKIAEGISFQVVEETKDNSLAGYLITTTGECLFRDEKLAEIRISNDGKLEFTLVYKLESTGRTFALDLF